MEALIVVSLVVMLIIVIKLNGKFSSEMRMLHNKIDKLSAEIKTLSFTKIDEMPEKKSVVEETKTEAHRMPPVIMPDPQLKKDKEQEKIEEPEEDKVYEAFPKLESVFEAEEEEVELPKVKIKEPPRPGFFERNPDLEKFIGENLANKIGIAILVLGIGFFVKYAIDQDWINEIGRVFIGILCGGALIGVAHRLRQTFVAFSSVLVGGGIAILYLTIAIAFHEYQIFDQSTAFVLMVGITGFAVALSLGYNRIELAVLAILGGFGSPFMVSTGEGNYVVLFTYILILDVGMLVLAYFKKWNLVNIICYTLTVLLYGSWLSTRFDDQQYSMIVGALLFATAFYLIFFAMNIINNLKERLPFKSIELTILLSNTFLYYGAGMALLDNTTGTDYKGLFTVLLGVFNFVFAYALYKKVKADKNLVYLLIALVLTFISLAAPVQLEGNYITLFWAAEAVLLLWLSQKSGIRLMKLGAVIIMGLMLVSLFMDWDMIYNDYSSEGLSIMLNKGYVTSLFSIGAVLATLFLLRNEKEEDPARVSLYKNILQVVLCIIVYLAQLLEMRYQFYYYEVSNASQIVIIGTYNMFALLCLLLFERRRILNQKVKDAFAFLGVFAMLLYLFLYHDYILATRYDYLFTAIPGTGFFFHYLLIALLIVVAAITLKKMRALTAFNHTTKDAYAWFYVFFFIFLASAELDHIVVLLSGTDINNLEHVLTQNQKIGYPILWGLSSFILIAIGLKRKKRHLRIISLTLFLITIVKLFVLDIQGISEGGKIVAFISLGLLLLVVSFMYQRLKKILLVDESVKDETENEKQA